MMMVFIMGSRSYLQLANLMLVGLLCMLTLTSFSMATGHPNVRCIEKERQALLNFKNSLVDEDNVLSSWGSEEEDCCRWKGIGCDNRTGRVIMLVLNPIIIHDPDRGNFYTWNPVNGEISPSLLELHYLSHLDLSFNQFKRIPQFIGSLTNLTYLNFSSCILDEPIPHQLGNLSNLGSLDLTVYSDSNNFINVYNLQWLSRLSSLRVLKMGGLNLVRSGLDLLQSIQNLPSLSTLMLNECQFPEIIPSSLSYTNSSKSLRVLYLDDNSFSNSSIFSWLFKICGNQLVDLSLAGNELKGPIPDSLAELSSLAYLDLSCNKLEGAGIPKFLGNLCNLQFLDLSANNLRDELPALLGNLTGCTKDSLEILSLCCNNLSGSLPGISTFSSLRELYLGSNQLDGSFPKSFGNVSKLLVMDLEDNKLIGSLPDVTKFPSLQELYLNDNQLEGSLPKSFGNLSKLLVLNLQRNHLTGSLHESIGQLSSLGVLDVSSNCLNGVITEAQLWNLSKLQRLDLSLNSLALRFNSNWVPPFQLDTIKLHSCNLGPQFPSWLRTQKNFSHLDISGSNISDLIPDWFWDLSSKLLYLNLSFNNIHGEVPNLSLRFDYFPGVDLSSNLFYGPIPQFLSKTALLNLSWNMFSGGMSFLCTMMDNFMNYLDLSDNLLSGGLPDCWIKVNSLVILNLENNNLSGIIPNSMGSLSKVETLRLRNNRFFGKLPSSLMNCNMLKLLDLGENKFSGKIPTWIGESSTNLIVLRLRSNEFNGNIPSTLCRLRSLQVLDLSLNNISGSIPACLSNFTAMTQKESSNVTISYGYFSESIYGMVLHDSYVDNALVIWKGLEREYGKTLGLLKVIDLSSNKLTGEIPGEVTSLLGLIAVNLSRNYLIGIIPKNIGLLKLLDSLDLSRNQLGGEIPMSLADISFLSCLNLSDNNLSGKIPSGTQLQGFTASAYMGNPQLCGPPLLIKCPGDETPNTSIDENIEEATGGEWFKTLGTYASMALGFIVGFWGVCGTLLLNRSRRHAYFKFLGDMWDWFYVITIVNIAKLQRRLRS